MQAGELAGAGEWDSLQGSGTLDSLWSSQRLSSYLVCVVEDPVEGKGTARVGRDGNGASGLGGATPGDEGTGAGAGAGKGGVEIGLVAVETSTGDVLYQQFRWGLRCRTMAAAVGRWAYIRLPSRRGWEKPWAPSMQSRGCC